MSRGSRGRSGAGSSHSSSPAKAPRFFKRIPPKFVSKYGKDLASLAFLKVPSGAVSQVELTTCKGDVWLCRGWQEFAEYYNIGFGHFLMFAYEGNSNFHVVIIDRSATEIEYPFSSNHGGPTNTNIDGNAQVRKEKDFERDGSIDILDEIKAGEYGGGTSTAQRCNESQLPSMKKFGTSKLKSLTFLKKYVSTKPNHVVLRIADGRTWFVKSHHWTAGRSQRCLDLFCAGQQFKCR